MVFMSDMTRCDVDYRQNRPFIIVYQDCNLVTLCKIVGRPKSYRSNQGKVIKLL